MIICPTPQHLYRFIAYKLVEAPDEETNEMGINVRNDEIPKDKHRSIRARFSTGTVKEGSSWHFVFDHLKNELRQFQFSSDELVKVN